MKAIERNVIAVGQLVEHPQHAMRRYSLGSGQIPKATVTGQESPPSLFCDRKGERVRDRKTCMLTADRGCPRDLSRGQLLDAHPPCDKRVTQHSREFAREEQVRHCEVGW